MLSRRALSFRNGPHKTSGLRLLILVALNPVEPASGWWHASRYREQRDQNVCSWAAVCTLKSCLCRNPASPSLGVLNSSFTSELLLLTGASFMAVDLDDTVAS